MLRGLYRAYLKVVYCTRTVAGSELCPVNKHALVKQAFVLLALEVASHTVATLVFLLLCVSTHHAT
jgi:hypothetical protein